MHYSTPVKDRRMTAISDEAMAAANEAFAAKLAWCDYHSIDVRREDGRALRAALEAAAPLMLAKARDEGYRKACDDIIATKTTSGPKPYREAAK